MRSCVGCASGYGLMELLRVGGSTILAVVLVVVRAANRVCVSARSWVLNVCDWCCGAGLKYK